MAEKTFISYIAETKTEYTYVLKFAVPEMTDEMIDCLESCLQKYDIKSASSFRKTPIQESPLDFPNVKNTPVFICDLVLGYPGSLDFIRTYLCSGMGIPLANLAVYSQNDPRQIETDLFLERSAPGYKDGYKTRLGSDHEATEGDTSYGEKYTTGFLKELAKVQGERKLTKVENPLSQNEKIDHSTLPKDYNGFNSDKNLKKDDVGLFGRIKKPNLIKVGKL